MNHIIYIDRHFDKDLKRVETICRSKVYKLYSSYTPSGVKKYARVWNNRLNKMVGIRLDIDLVKVID